MYQVLKSTRNALHRFAGEVRLLRRTVAYVLIGQFVTTAFTALIAYKILLR